MILIMRFDTQSGEGGQFFLGVGEFYPTDRLFPKTLSGYQKQDISLVNQLIKPY